MPRVISTAALAALQSRAVALAYLVEGTFQTGPVYLWTGFGNLTWNGNTWVGVGQLGGISPIEDGATVEATRGITLTLSGIDPTLLPLVLGEFQLRAPVTVYLGLFAGGALIANPIVAFSGLMDQPIIDLDGKTAILSINCEQRLLELNVATDRRYTADDQQRDWPGDLGMQFVNGIQEMTIYWGNAPTSAGNL
jgi:hypothetical protein